MARALVSLPPYPFGGLIRLGLRGLGLKGTRKTGVGVEIINGLILLDGQPLAMDTNLLALRS